VISSFATVIFFTVYVNYIGYIISNERMITNGQLREEVAAYFQVLPQCVPEASF
jgi:hypothetical protein